MGFILTNSTCQSVSELLEKGGLTPHTATQSPYTPSVPPMPQSTRVPFVTILQFNRRSGSTPSLVRLNKKFQSYTESTWTAQVCRLMVSTLVIHGLQLIYRPRRD